jgi:hypothetical protein
LKGYQYSFRARPIIEDLDKCRVKYTNKNPFGLKVVGGNGNAPSIPDSIKILPSDASNECTRENIKFSKQKIEELNKLIEQSTSPASLIENLWKVSYFISSSNVQSCLNYLDTFLKTDFKEFFYNSSECSYEIQTFDWENGFFFL